VIIQQAHHHQAKELVRKMSSPAADDDNDMKALRAHYQQIEASQSADKSRDPVSDENQRFDCQEPPTAIKRDDTEPWKRLKLGKDLHKVHFDLSRRVRLCIDP
jgi:hypothetical protein